MYLYISCEYTNNTGQTMAVITSSSVSSVVIKDLWSEDKDNWSFLWTRTFLKDNTLGYSEEWLTYWYQKVISDISKCAILHRNLMHSGGDWIYGLHVIIYNRFMQNVESSTFWDFLVQGQDISPRGSSRTKTFLEDNNTVSFSHLLQDVPSPDTCDKNISHILELRNATIKTMYSDTWTSDMIWHGSHRYKHTAVTADRTKLYSWHNLTRTDRVKEPWHWCFLHWD